MNISKVIQTRVAMTVGVKPSEFGSDLCECEQCKKMVHPDRLRETWKTSKLICNECWEDNCDMCREGYGETEVRLFSKTLEVCNKCVDGLTVTD